MEKRDSGFGFAEQPEKLHGLRGRGTLPLRHEFQRTASGLIYITGNSHKCTNGHEGSSVNSVQLTRKVRIMILLKKTSAISFFAGWWCVVQNSL
jgi:hypothetical protein